MNMKSQPLNLLTTNACGVQHFKHTLHKGDKNVFMIPKQQTDSIHTKVHSIAPGGNGIYLNDEN